MSTYVQPSNSSQVVPTYVGAIDASTSVMSRVAAMFACHENSSLNMQIKVDAGAIYDGTNLTEIAQQTSGTITAPVSNPRIDRVVIDRRTGVLQVVAGSEAVSPVPPAIPSGKLHCARISLATGQTTIANANITDERQIFTLGTTSLVFLSIGAGLTDDGSGNLKVAIGNGLGLSGNTIVVLAADSSLAVGPSGVQTNLATDPGLEVSSGLKVKPGNGLQLSASGVEVKVADTSLATSASGVQANLATNPGLEVGTGLKVKTADSSLALSASGLQANLATNPGLEVSAGLKVKPGDGIALSAGGVGVNLSATPGLEFSTAQIQVKADAANRGVSVDSNGVGMSISSMTELTTGDSSADFLPIYDTSASAHRKIKPANLGIATGKLVQRKYLSYATHQAITSSIPFDDTIPQNTEGTEVLTQAITPTKSTNILRVSVFANASGSGGNITYTLALFRDSGADAKYATGDIGTHNRVVTSSFAFEETSGVTSATTYKLRVGPEPSGTIYTNGSPSTRWFGGILAWTMIVEELEP
ncbi:MAG: hypothetical protein ACKVSF_06350 [Alphaproteobacteria bacterium]